MDSDSSPTNAAGKRHTRRWLVALIAIACIRIASTYTTFSETVDEPVHFGAGLEILDKHSYASMVLNPPLPRIFFALGPWLDGTHFNRIDPLYDHVPDVFQSPRGYRRTLALARTGNLVFFVLGALSVWWWARREVGERAAIATLFLFTMEPILLGYSVLVTHDVAAIAGVALAVVAMYRWIDRPTALNAALVGAAYGFGVACKFSCIPFTPAACAVIFLSRIRTVPWRKIWMLIVVVPVAAAAVVWVSYGLSFQRFIEGVRSLNAVNNGPFVTYLFGRMSRTGFLWYFPTALLLKATIALLLFAVAGLFAPNRGAVVESFAIAAVMLTISMTSPLDLGVRYILPLFAPLCVAAGAGLVAMWERRREAAMLVAAWLVVASAHAHPDYFPYFNELAGRDPSRFLIDSNLDWGQDMIRLSKTLRHLKVPEVGTQLFTNTNLDALHFPAHHPADALIPAKGWLAISVHAYRMDHTQGGWNWRRGDRFAPSASRCASTTFRNGVRASVVHFLH